MATSTRFCVATHILAALAINRNEAVTSDQIAASVNTNAAFVRRILCDLAKAGLTTSRLGKGGGAVLAKAPKKISLLDIYEAVEEPGIVKPPRGAADQQCVVGRNVQPALRRVTLKAEAAFFETLKSSSLKEIVREVKADGMAAEN